MILQQRLNEYLGTLEQKGLLRTRVLRETKSPEPVFFDSNDYLSLSCEPKIAKAYEYGYKNYPSGSGASMVLSGYHENHRNLEQAFSDFLGVDECILFSSGYAANLAVTSLLGRLEANALIDKGIHASVYDGLRLSQVEYTRFLHNDLDDFTQKYSLTPPHSVVMTEALFSMSGQQAPLDTMAALCKANQTPLLVDEAHAFGVIGPQGAGAVSAYGLTMNEVPLRVIPLGKAFAAQGAVVAGSYEWIQALVQAGRALIYSTAISPALSYGLLKTLEIMSEAEERRTQLNHLITVFREQVKTSPLSWGNSASAIQQLQLGCAYRALDWMNLLKDKGIFCSAIRPPTVNLKTTGLRIILNSKHTEEQIKLLFTQLHELYEN
jgi:8-amino-7-oxononanoate synthase